MGERVFVTGATGFIGSHLTRELLTRGDEVHILRRPTSDGWRLTDIRSRLHEHIGDLTDFASVKKAVDAARPEVVYHLGAYVNVGRTLQNANAIADVIIGGTLRLWRALDGHNYRVFVNSGTCEEYGDNPVPFREEQLPAPVSPYSAAKTAVTFYGLMYHKTLGLPIVTLRPFLTYGPMQQPARLIPQAIIAGLTKTAFRTTPGEQTREFNYVDDIVAGYIKAAHAPSAIGEVINLGNGREIQIRRVIRLIFDLLGNPIEPEIGALPYRPGETWHFYADPGKAKCVLGWEATTPLRDGLRRTITWYRQHKEHWQ